ncbi:MAG TPA: helix-turn-helix transcriptional regulator [Vicinamibacteria bacterium]|nr:helix-turn-helix transcriptional regulator [Vicinamibacteria bacterium]
MKSKRSKTMQATTEAKVQQEMHVEVGRRIRELRLKKSLLQEELARKAGLSASALSNFEQGRRRISLDWLRKISKVLSVTVSDLIPDSRIRKPLAENEEEENLLASWRRIGNTDLQDQLLELIELTAQSQSKRRSRSN